MYLDSKISMEEHVSYLCSTCYYHLRNIGAILHLITKDTAPTLAQSLNNVKAGLLQQSGDRDFKSTKAVKDPNKLRSHVKPGLKSQHYVQASKRTEGLFHYM